MALKKGVFILEGIPQYEGKNEGNMLYEFIKMILPDRVEMWYDFKSYNDFFDSLKSNNHKFIHISTHGDVDDDGNVFLSLPNKLKLYPDELASAEGLNGRNI